MVKKKKIEGFIIGFKKPKIQKRKAKIPKAKRLTTKKVGEILRERKSRRLMK